MQVSVAEIAQVLEGQWPAMSPSSLAAYRA